MLAAKEVGSPLLLTRVECVKAVGIRFGEVCSSNLDESSQAI